MTTGPRPTNKCVSLSPPERGGAARRSNATTRGARCPKPSMSGVEDDSLGERGGREENRGGRGRRKRTPAGLVIAPIAQRTGEEWVGVGGGRLGRRGPGYIGDHTNLAGAAVGRRWVAAVLNKLVQELLPVSSLKERLSSVSPDSASLDVKWLQASAAHFKFSDQLGGQTRDRPQTRQMQQTQHYDQHESNTCPGKMHR